jgi:hypothetical protein
MGFQRLIINSFRKQNHTVVTKEVEVPNINKQRFNHKKTLSTFQFIV